MNGQRRQGFYEIDFVRDSFSKPWPVFDGQHVLDLMRQPAVEADMRSIRQGRPEAKRYLPAVVWGGRFEHQRRRDAECRPSGLFCLDVDHITTEGPEGVRRFYQEHFGGREDELDIVFAHISPSGDGLHVVALCQPGLQSIAQNQAWLAAAAGSAYDPVCRNLGRIYYLSTADEILYNDLI